MHWPRRNWSASRRSWGWIPRASDATADRLVILRHTLMNPYLIDRENGISYIDRYFDYLATRVRALA